MHNELTHEYYEINVYYLIIIFKKAYFKCKKLILPNSATKTLEKMEMAFLNKDLEDRLTPETKTCLRLEPIE